MRTFLLACTLWFGAAVAGAAPNDSPTSLYRLDAQLVDQDGQTHGLDIHRGHPVLITMFYGSCPMTCPLLIDTLKAVERTTPAAQRKDLRVLLISVDPENDTPAVLAELAHQRRIDTTRWTLARGDERTVRKIAALLNIQYRKLPDGSYNHSSIITMLSAQGEIRIQSNVLGKTDAALIAAITAAAPLAATGKP